MRVVVASQTARVCGPRIRNGIGSVWRYQVEVKVREPLAGNAPASAAHSVGGMACGTGEAVINMPGVLGKAGVRNDLVQIVALRAHRIGTVHAKVRARKEIRDQLAWQSGLAELVPALQDVRPFGPVRPVRTLAAELAIVIAIVAVAAENLYSHAAGLCYAVQIQHVG